METKTESPLIIEPTTTESSKSSVSIPKVRRTVYAKVDTFDSCTPLLDYFSRVGKYLDLNELYTLLQSQGYSKKYPNAEIYPESRRMKILYRTILQQETNMVDPKEYPDQTVALASFTGSCRMFQIRSREMDLIMSPEDQMKFFPDREKPEARQTHMFVKMTGTQKQFNLLEKMISFSEWTKGSRILFKNPVKFYFKPSSDYRVLELVSREEQRKLDWAVQSDDEDYDKDSSDYDSSDQE